jgi:hypothetical protein
MCGVQAARGDPAEAAATAAAACLLDPADGSAGLVEAPRPPGVDEGEPSEAAAAATDAVVWDDARSP